MPSINSLSLTDIARALGGDVCGDQVKAPGPGHGRGDRSMCVKPDPRAPRGFYVHSHAGNDDLECKDFVAEKLGLPTFTPRKPNGKGHGNGKVATHDAKDTKPNRRVVAVYEYWSADGELLYVKKRFEPKDFRQYAADGTPGLKGTTQVLYRLPELIEAGDAVAYVTEGEVDCDRVRGLGLCAVSADSGTWEKPGLIDPLRGRDVVILPDNDATGEARALEAAKALHGVVATIRIVRLPELGPKEDVSDYLDRHAEITADTFTELCLREELWTPSAAVAAVGLVPDNRNANDGLTRDNFYAYMPAHNYICLPTREPWPASSVDEVVPPIDVGKEKSMRASAWLDRHRRAVQMTWAPGEPLEIRDRVVGDGGWIEHKGVVTLNLYRSPVIKPGNAANAKRWVDHVRKVFSDDAEHIINWLAQRTQNPAVKINHALVLGGVQGIGKDTILEPIKHAVGPWNFIETSPSPMLGRFNGFLKSTVLRVSEARDLGEVNKFAFYEHMKAYTAAPPDVLRVDEKHLREHSILNCTGVIMTTNHKVGGIYLPADDRRHFVAWSPCRLDDFEDGYWDGIWSWYRNGGIADVAAFLRERDISEFNPKAPPAKTPAFWEIVDASAVPEDAELMDALEAITERDRLKDAAGNPTLPAAVTLERVKHNGSPEFAIWLAERKNWKTMPYRFEKCGYAPIRNPTAKDGYWRVSGRRVVVYVRNDQTMAEKLKAANALTGGKVDKP